MGKSNKTVSADKTGTKDNAAAEAQIAAAGAQTAASGVGSGATDAKKQQDTEVDKASEGQGAKPAWFDKFYKHLKGRFDGETLWFTSDQLAFRRESDARAHAKVLTDKAVFSEKI